MEEASIGKAKEENHASPKLFERIKKEIPASPKLFKSIKKSFTTKKTGAPNSETSLPNTIEDSRNDIENEIGVDEATDAVVEVLETKDAVQQEDAADKEIPASHKLFKSMKKSLTMTEKEKDTIVEANVDVPVVEAKETATALEPEKDALVLLVETSSAETEAGIETVQQEGCVVLGFFEHTSSIKEKDVSLLEQVSTSHF